MEKGIKIVKKAREVKKYDTLDAALKAKNDEARAYLKNVKWPEKMAWAFEWVEKVLRQNPLHQFPMNVRQTETPPLKLIGKSFVINP